MNAEVEKGKRRLAVMLGIDLVCVVIAAAAAYGAFARGVEELMWVFAAALVAGLAAQIWFIAGFLPTKKGV